MRILGVVGARPNFMKIDPIFRAIREERADFDTILLHTGQHYDDNMSRVFFEQLEMRKPDINLGVGSGTHAEQTGKIMIEIEKVIKEKEPDLVMVVGDVNSTIAASVTATKLHVPVAHVEAGLRSSDRRMPEEINRIVTDSLSSLLFTTSREAGRNLRGEGIESERIFFVGNVMIDTLKRCYNLTANSNVRERLGVKNREFALLTMHRPSNVDNRNTLIDLLNTFKRIQSRIPVIFPIHPRTENRIEEYELNSFVEEMDDFIITPPLGYLDFLKLEGGAKFILTDSGGIQEEATVLKVPCLTLRENTERPITVEEGTNVIVGRDRGKILEEVSKILDGRAKEGRTPELWDGNAGGRIVNVLTELEESGGIKYF